jgi:hypothetical protein
MVIIVLAVVLTQGLAVVQTLVLVHASVVVVSMVMDWFAVDLMVGTIENYTGWHHSGIFRELLNLKKQY